MSYALDLKATARKIFQQTLAAIDIAETMRKKLARKGSIVHCCGMEFDLASFAQIRVIALGKASHAMAEGLSAVCAPEFPLSGILVASTPPPRVLPGFELFVGGHPIPNEKSFAAARAILRMLSECGAGTLVFFLVSGGGSALVELPLRESVSLADTQSLNRLLVGCGGSIDEINAVRKHLSAVKGGRLAAAAPEALKITLGVTDVPEGRESALASGPTLPDTSTVADARQVIQHYDLLAKLPSSIRTMFEDSAGLPETPKPGDTVFRNAHFEIILGMRELFQHAQSAAEAAGFTAICDNSTDDWPLARASEYLLQQLARLSKENPGRPVAVIADGEVSSPVHGKGIGGRNAAFVLDCVSRIAGRKIAVLSAGTDGIDGTSPAAGAVADGETLSRARAAGMDPAEFDRRSDSYNFFHAIGDSIVTGPTGNNLRDLRILLTGGQE
jgi:hydroxypyruvate reductase